MRYFLLVVMILSVCVKSFSQTKITGRVADKDGHAMEGFVTLNIPGESNILSFADIDGEGMYALDYNGSADSICIRVSGFQIGNYSKVVANRSQTLNFMVEVKGINLKEVDVKADPVTIKGDTTDYLVSSYQQQGDRVIGDVLKRVPGVEVSKSGEITYNGKAISKFYVEEMDMLQGRYGLAVNNITADAVSKVQVMEHHQPVKMLQGMGRTDEVAINLKLKEKAKGTYVLATALGAGISERQGKGVRGLWNEELVGMYFGKERQTMQTYKGNNSGDDILAELSNQYGSAGLAPVSRVHVSGPGTPGVPQKRYMDNKTHALSHNWLERLDKDKEMVFNAVYSHDLQNREGYTYTEWYRPEADAVRLHESQFSTNRSHSLDLSHRYTDNSSRHYTSNALSAHVSWNDDRVDGQIWSQNYNSIVIQRMRSTPLRFYDKFIIQRRMGDDVLRFNVFGGYAQSSQKLRVVEHEDSCRMQELMPRTISLGAFTSYIKQFRHVRGEYGFNGRSAIYGEEGMLMGHADLNAEDCRNRMWYGIYRVSVFQDYTYMYKRGDIKLGLPVALDAQSSNDMVRHNRHVFFRPIIQPSLSVSYDWKVYNTLQGKLHFEQQVGDFNSLFHGYVMEDYRTVLRSQVKDMFTRKNINVSGNYQHSNALRQFFFNANAGYSHTWRNQIDALVYDGIYCTSIIHELQNGSSSVFTGIGMSKNFSWKKCYVKLNVGYSHNEYQRLIDGNLMSCSGNLGRINVAGSITPLRWIGLVASFGGMVSRTSCGRSVSDMVKDYMGRISLKLCPIEQLTLNVSAEGTYDNWNAKNHYRYFSDAGIQYSFRKMSLELEGNNLLNQKKYVMNRNDNMDMYHLEYALRPRNILLKVRFNVL